MNRRQCLGVVLAGSAGIGLGAGGSCLCSLSRRARNAPLLLGNLADIPDHGVRDFPGWDIAVLRSRGRLVFLVSRCTHLGCKLRLAGREWVCPCHGGRFSLEGKVRGGPPRQALVSVRGELGPAGELLVYPDQREL